MADCWVIVALKSLLRIDHDTMTFGEPWSATRSLQSSKIPERIIHENRSDNHNVVMLSTHGYYSRMEKRCNPFD
jgi:hypothetical protein